MGALLVSSAAAQSYGLLVTPPIVVSANVDAGGVYFSRPGADPSIAVTPKTSTTPETVHVLWWVQSEFNPGGNDALWYASQGAGPWLPPMLYTPEAGKPRLAIGPQGHLHAAFLSYRADSRMYDADYVERLPDDPPPLPPPHNDPNGLVFPTSWDNDDLSLTVSSKDGKEYGHVVWSEYSGLRPPPLYYGRAYRVRDNFQVVGETFGAITPDECADPFLVGCYQGYAPAIATQQGGQELHLVWEGRERFPPQNQTIYWGYRRLNCPIGETCSWSFPQPISSNFVAKQAKTSQAACQVPPSNPALKAILPSVAISSRWPYSLHAIWLQQRVANGPYYVHTARLVAPENGEYCWDHFEYIDYAPVPNPPTGLPSERPRLAFDHTGRRYAVWNVGLQSIVVSTSKLLDDTGPYHEYAAWEPEQRLSTGACDSAYGVRGMDLATLRPDLAPNMSSQFVHVVWAAVEQAGQLEGRICYARLSYGYQSFVPQVLRANNPGH